MNLPLACLLVILPCASGYPVDEEILKRQQFAEEKQRNAQERAQLSLEIQQLAQERQQLAQDRSEMANIMAKLQNAVHESSPQRYTRQSEGVAFSVWLDHSATLGPSQVIRFNRVITNEGSGYNVHSGVFTCPQAGMYLFAFMDLQGGNTVVLRLQQGDVVEIEEQYGNHVEGYGTLGLTSFTGVLLYP
ncbi:complement C1q subcomponent subunit B-like [Mya arenaria]|uniref:complement C1q subcomponent subunit B-like n=1 Tax=Mya arenaria TaxID=6604 RepID=UPI0022DF2133|nr:complement C1q subcomponent subunit B-like [Mya arenaria]